MTQTLIQWAKMPETQDGEYIFDKCYALLCDISGNVEAWKSYKNYIRSLGFEYLGAMRLYVDHLVNLKAKLEEIFKHLSHARSSLGKYILM